MTVLVVEDRSSFSEPLVEALQGKIRGEKVVRLSEEHIKSAMEKSNIAPPEDNFRALFCDEFEPIAGAVVDHNLTQFSAGVSEVPIIQALTDLAVPICRYAQGFDASRLQQPSKRLKLLSSPDTQLHIAHDSDPKVLACNAAQELNGFVEIQDRLAIRDPSSMSGASNAELLADLLEFPGLESWLSLYGTGTPVRADRQQVEQMWGEKARVRILGAQLGYWLRRSIIQFPGLLISQSVLATYLGVSQDLFVGCQKVRDRFEECRYNGPFSELDDLYWRPAVDQMIIKNETTGSEICREQAESAGLSFSEYKLDGPYITNCLLTGAPVTEEGSYGGLDWIPDGADLSRVAKSDYDENAPWIGL